MYALAVLRYRKPLDENLPHVDAHRASLRGLEAEGVVLAPGPFERRDGGAILLRLPEAEAL